MNEDIAPGAQDFLAEVKNIFSVSVEDLHRIMGDFHHEMERGLEGEKGSLRMLPSFLGRPRGTEQGDFLAVDLGGTNIRVLEVKLDGRRHAALAASSRFAIPKEIQKGSGEGFFDFIAGSIQSFFSEHRISAGRLYDLAFTFSFPVDQISIASGRLISWTKGFSASSVEGGDVVALLSEALRRHEMGFIRVVALVNDTVGTLAAGSYLDPACDMGVILGTGTNACYPEKAARVKKLPDIDPVREMIINIEWGNFNKLKTNRYDRLLDRASPNRGQQRLEKMASGMYIGELARLILVAMIERGFICKGKRCAADFKKAYAWSSEEMAHVMEKGAPFANWDLGDEATADVQVIREICRIVSARAARLAGALIAAVVCRMDPELDSDHTIAVDGALFEKYPGFKDKITETLRELLGARASKIKLSLVKDGSGIGAAILGGVASFSRAEKREKT
jgi:hexokinase